MKFITYSDLHLEFSSGWTLPRDAHGDVMILASDIITLRGCKPLDRLLQKWKNPVVYVTGNHEYYTQRPMNEEEENFKAWLSDCPTLRIKGLDVEPSARQRIAFRIMWKHV
jgi:hypothetical protein